MTATEEIIVRKYIQNATIRNCIEIVRWVDFPLSDIGAWVVALVIIYNPCRKYRTLARINYVNAFVFKIISLYIQAALIFPSSLLRWLFHIRRNLHFWWFACKIMAFLQNFLTATKTSTSVNFNNKNFKFLHVNRLFKWLRFFSKMNETVKLSK